jgi:hypothetical protein
LLNCLPAGRQVKKFKEDINQMADDQFNDQKRQMELENKARIEQQAAAAAEVTRAEASEDERIERLKQENEERVKEQAAAVAAMQGSETQESKTKKKVKRRIIGWLATSGCACCLPAIVFLATIGIVTIIVFYIEGLFDNSTATPAATNQTIPLETTANNGNR